MPSTPDTNIFVYAIIQGTEDQYEKSREYLSMRGEEKIYILNRVKSEFNRIVDDKLGNLRDFAMYAERFGNWREAEQAADYESDNLMAALKRLGQPETAQRDLSEIQARCRKTFRRKISWMEKGAEKQLSNDLKQEIKSNLDVNGNESQEVEGDSEVVGQAYYTSWENSKNIMVVTLDDDILNADFEAIKEEFRDAIEGEFRSNVNSKTPDQQIGFVRS